jgi:hypothetical protein
MHTSFIVQYQSSGPPHRGSLFVEKQNNPLQAPHRGSLFVFPKRWLIGELSSGQPYLFPFSNATGCPAMAGADCMSALVLQTVGS